MDFVDTSKICIVKRNYDNNTNMASKPISDNSELSIFEDKSQAGDLINEFNEVKNKQGFLGKAWDGLKKLTGIGLSSNKTEEKISQYQNGEISYEEAHAAIEEFESKQKNITDMASSIASGLVVAGSAVVTGGTSLAASAVIGV